MYGWAVIIFLIQTERPKKKKKKKKIKKEKKHLFPVRTELQGPFASFVFQWLARDSFVRWKLCSCPFYTPDMPSEDNSGFANGGLQYCYASSV